VQLPYNVCAGGALAALKPPRWSEAPADPPRRALSLVRGLSFAHRSRASRSVVTFSWRRTCACFIFRAFAYTRERVEPLECSEINMPLYVNRAAVTNAQVNELGAPVSMVEHGDCQSSKKAAILARESIQRVGENLIRPEDRQ
jgi:hypothetical protein